MKAFNTLTSVVLIAISLNVSADDKIAANKKSSSNTTLSIQNPEINWGSTDQLDGVSIKLLDLKFPEMEWGKHEEIKASQTKLMDIKSPDMIWGTPAEVEENLEK